MHFFELIWQRLNVCQRLAKRTKSVGVLQSRVPHLLAAMGVCHFTTAETRDLSRYRPLSWHLSTGQRQ